MSKFKELCQDLDEIKSVTMDDSEINGYFLYVSFKNGDRGYTRYQADNYMPFLGMLHVLIRELEIGLVNAISSSDTTNSPKKGSKLN